MKEDSVTDPEQENTQEFQAFKDQQARNEPSAEPAPMEPKADLNSKDHEAAVQTEKVTKSRRGGRVKPDATLLRVKRISPWGVAINSLFASVTLALALETLVFFLWKVMDASGIFEKLVNTVAPTGGESADKMYAWLTLDKFLTVGAVMAVSVLVLIPLLAFFLTVIYNLASKLTGGVKVVLTSGREQA